MFNEERKGSRGSGGRVEEEVEGSEPEEELMAGNQ